MSVSPAQRTSCRCRLESFPKEGIDPFQVGSIEIVGPLKTSIINHRYVLKMFDCAFRWTEAMHLTNIRADTVFKAQTRAWIHMFGPPRYFYQIVELNLTQQVPRIGSQV